MKTNTNGNSTTEQTVQALGSSPDFQRNICLVVRDKSGREIFRSAPLFSAVEAERIGDQGAEEYFEVGMTPADGVEFPGMAWDAKGFYWHPAKVEQESGV